MKVRASIKKRTPDSKIVRRKGRLYVINKRTLNSNSAKADLGPSTKNVIDKYGSTYSRR